MSKRYRIKRQIEKQKEIDKIKRHYRIMSFIIVLALTAAAICFLISNFQVWKINIFMGFGCTFIIAFLYLALLIAILEFMRNRINKAIDYLNRYYKRRFDI